MKSRVVILVAACLLAGCSGNSQKKEIERVAYAYLDAMGNYRIEEAVPFSSTEARNTTIAVFLRLMKFADTAKLMENTPAEITITGVRILTDTTARAYFHKHTPIVEQTDSIPLVLEDGQWLVDVCIKMPSFMTDTIQLPDSVIRKQLEANRNKSVAQ